MNSQEIQVLQDFLNQLTQVRGVCKEPQADVLIASAVAQQPDAAYLLVQRALLMEQALNTAKAQIATLQNQLQALQASTASGSSHSFLDANAWGNTATATAATRPWPAPAPAPAPALAAQAAAPAYPTAANAAPGFFSGALGGTLGRVAATAAGVAGGAFLFQGIEHLMNSGSSGSLMQQGNMGAPVENTTINNYYVADDSRNDAADSNGSLDYADNSDSGDYDDSLI